MSKYHETRIHESALKIITRKKIRTRTSKNIAPKQMIFDFLLYTSSSLKTNLVFVDILDSFSHSLFTFFYIFIRLKVLILLRFLTFQISCKTNMLISRTGTVFTLVFISCKTKILQLFSFLLRTKKRFECFSTFVTWRSILFTQKKLIFCLFVFTCKKSQV